MMRNLHAAILCVLCLQIPRCLMAQEFAVLEGHTDDVYSAVFSPDGKLLASGSFDQTIRLWDVALKKQMGILRGHAGYVYGVAFSPDGKVLASGGEDNTVRLWDVTQVKEIVTLKGHVESGGVSGVGGVTFSPDGKILISGGADGVHLWDVGKNIELATLAGGLVTSIALSPDGKTLALGGHGKTVELWDITQQRQVVTLKGHTGSVRSVAFSSDGRLLASAGQSFLFSAGESADADTSVRLWDVVQQKEIGIFIGHASMIFQTGGVSSVAFSHDGKALASGGTDGTVRLWDVAQKKQVAVLDGGRQVYSVAFSPDGKLLASAAYSYDKRLCLWDVTQTITLLSAGNSLASDFDGNGAVDFNDFFLFASLFGKKRGDSGFEARYDLSKNEVIDFDDFFIFAADFGKKV